MTDHNSPEARLRPLLGSQMPIEDDKPEPVSFWPVGVLLAFLTACLALSSWNDELLLERASLQAEVKRLRQIERVRVEPEYPRLRALCNRSQS